MASYTGTFSAAGDVSPAIRLTPGQQLTYSLTESATGVYSNWLEKSTNPKATWERVSAHTADVSSTTITNDSTQVYFYRLRCNSVAVVTIDYTFADVSGETQKEFTNPQTGVVEMEFTDQGVKINRNLSVSGNQTITGTQTFTGDTAFSGAVSVLDTFTIGGTTDPTKKVRFEPDGNTTATTRVITVLNENMTLVGLASTQTLTNKTLTSAAITAQATDAAIGTVAAPASGTTAVTIARLGNFFYLTFTLTAARIAVTDGAASGSYGATKLFDFVEGGISFLGCRQNYTAYAADGTGVPADDAFVIGVGNTAIASAADGVLAAGEQNVGASIAQTLSGGTTTGTKFTNAGSAYDGTATAADLYLNFSGDAATTDGNGTIDVTGTITVVGVFLGDD